jgi:hypothetical protein
MATINKITGIVEGQYGTAIALQVVDDEGQVVNLSSYTGATVRTVSPDARTTLSFTATLIGGGAGGQFSFTPTSANTFDRDGIWKAQVQFTATDILSLTIIFEIEVDRKL